MRLIIISIIIFSFLFSFVVAEVPDPPPTPDIGSGDSGSSNEDDNIPPPPNFGGLAANQEEPKEPNLECPAKTSGWTIFLLILDLLLLGVIAFLIMYFMKKQRPVHTVEKKGFSDDIIYDGLGPIRDYINDCRAKGFDDDKIKVELLKNGYEVETIKKLF